MNNDKPKLHVVSFSGGKDSTAMLLRMLEEGMPVDIILFCDTGIEFPAMYDHIAKVEKNIGRKITVVKPERTFEDYLLNASVNRNPKSSVIRKYGPLLNGYGWAGPKMRWCTWRLKNQPRDEYLRKLREKYDIIQYVGLAADEGYRLKRISNQRSNLRHPLVDWGMTEADCLQYCYDCGYDWSGMYEKHKRVSCWCCPLQTLAELRVLHRDFPNLWEQLKKWDSMTWRDFKEGYSVERLEQRFDFEDEWQKAGRELGTKAFYVALREKLEADSAKNDRREGNENM